MTVSASPASGPSKVGIGVFNSNSVEDIAVVESRLSDNQVDFTLYIDRVYTKLLLDTGAKSSYASKEYILQRSLKTRFATGLPLVCGVWSAVPM